VYVLIEAGARTDKQMQTTIDQCMGNYVLTESQEKGDLVKLTRKVLVKNSMETGTIGHVSLL
jgi:hypothetical protein